MRSGFSLVELSVVLAIIGLITGGILMGQNLIRSAELRAVVAEMERYQSAAKEFRETYHALPGDLPNATEYWGSMSNCSATNPTYTGKQTCNGDGDGILDPAPQSFRSGELFQFWRHLANAGFIDGHYSGISGDHWNGVVSISGVNSPVSKLKDGTWSAIYRNLNNNSIFYDIDFGNTLQIGKERDGGNAFEPVMTPAEAYNIDKKIDDGLPGKGNLYAIYWDECGGASTDDDFESEYRLTNDDIVCSLLVRDAFQ